MFLRIPIPYSTGNFYEFQRCKASFVNIELPIYMIKSLALEPLAAKRHVPSTWVLDFYHPTRNRSVTRAGRLVNQ